MRARKAAPTHIRTTWSAQQVDEKQRQSQEPIPRYARLPDDLKKLARRNALEISDSRWNHDVGVLIRNLEKAPRAKH
jgi:hypothetical protein